jgi:hypothetical protein
VYQLSPEQVHEMGSLAVATLIDLMRTEKGPIGIESALELVRLQNLVREVRGADADAIIREAAELAIPRLQAELARRRAGKAEALIHGKAQ